MIRLPGVCIVCRAPVVWTGKSWKNPGQRSGRHACENGGQNVDSTARTSMEWTLIRRKMSS